MMRYVMFNAPSMTVHVCCHGALIILCVLVLHQRVFASPHAGCKAFVLHSLCRPSSGCVSACRTLQPQLPPKLRVCPSSSWLTMQALTCPGIRRNGRAEGNPAVLAFLAPPTVRCPEGVKAAHSFCLARCDMGLHRRYMFRASGRIVVRCVVDIAPGEELTLAYTNLAQPRTRCVLAQAFGCATCGRGTTRQSKASGAHARPRAAALGMCCCGHSPAPASELPHGASTARDAPRHHRLP